MAYIHLFQNEKWWSHSSYSYGYISMEYSHWREGANQCYKINYSAGVSSGAYYKNGINIYVILDGVSHCIGSGIGTNNSGSWYHEGSGTYSIANKTSGHTGFYAAVYDAKTGTLLWAGGTANLNVDPAQANFTAHSIASITETSVTVNWNADAACDAIQYSFGGGWIDTGGHPNYTVTGLNHGTTYTIKTRIRRKDSQLWTESGTLSFSTYYYPHCTSSPNFTIGNQVTLTIYNPLGRSVSIYMVGANGTTQGGDTITGTSISGYNNSSWTDWWYSTVPNSNRGTYQVLVKYGSVTMTRSSAGTYDVTNANPTFTNWDYEDTNSRIIQLTGNNKILVKGYSTVRGVVTTSNKATANKHASMNKYQLNIGGGIKEATYSSSNTVYTDSILVNTNTFTMYAIDSRTNSTAVQKTIDISNYRQYSDISLDASNTYATRENKIGSKTILNVEGKIWNNSFGNTFNAIDAFTVEYKLTSETDDKYKAITVDKPTLSGNTFRLNAPIRGDLEADGFTSTSSFNIRIKVTDKLSSATRVITLGSGAPNLAIHKNGVAINQAYNTDVGGALQVNGQVVGNHGGSWRQGRDRALVKNISHGQQAGYSFNPVASIKTTLGSWELGNLSGDEGLTFSYVTDNDYTTDNNKNIRLNIAKPTKESWLMPATVLYDNSSGTTGTVSFTSGESAANYSYLEIFGKTDQGYFNVKVPSPNGKVAFMIMAWHTTESGYDLIQYVSKRYQISGTSITRVTNGVHNERADNNNWLSVASAHDYIKIVKVVGYR